MTPTRVRPALHDLEARTVPAGITFTQGHLVVDGTAAADTIRVYFYGADADPRRRCPPDGNASRVANRPPGPDRIDLRRRAATAPTLFSTTPA